MLILTIKTDKFSRLCRYLGFSIAGQSSLRNMKPDTTLVLTYLSLGHFCITSRCRLAQIYLGGRADDIVLLVAGMWDVLPECSGTGLARHEYRLSNIIQDLKNAALQT